MCNGFYNVYSRKTSFFSYTWIVEFRRLVCVALRAIIFLVLFTEYIQIGWIMALIVLCKYIQ